MTIEDFITELFCHVDDELTEQGKNHKHSQAKLYPSEVVTLGLLYALKGCGQRAFWRWLTLSSLISTYSTSNTAIPHIQFTSPPCGSFLSRTIPDWCD